MAFDKNNDKIAIVVPRFKLLRSSDGPVLTEHLYSNEPYLVTVALDQNGVTEPKIHFNMAPYPNMMEGDEVQMLGHGHLVYGPANPGEWVAVSVLLMECDDDVREVGEALGGIVSKVSKAQAIGALLSMNPTVQIVSAALMTVTSLIAQALASNGDDELFRTQGAFLRDRPVPYDVNRSFRRSNKMADLDVAVLQLTAPNGQGPQTRAVNLA